MTTGSPMTAEAVVPTGGAAADVADPVAARDGRSADPTIRQQLYRIRWLLATGAVLLVACIGLAYYGSSAHGGTLDPRSYDPSGSHALGTLLSQRGVTVTTATDVPTALASAQAGTTLVVVRPDYLDAAELAQVATSPADLVVVGADQSELAGLWSVVAHEQVLAVESGVTESTQPQCAAPAAVIAGSAELGRLTYQASESATRCYPGDGGYGLVSFTAGGRQVTLLGDAAPLENENLAADGNAALSIGLLDTHQRVTWLIPLAVAPQASAGAQQDITDLMPSRLKQALVWLAIAMIVVALWRGRRFGRLVREDLPVVVRRAEVVVGRARLYQRSKSRDSAAEALRSGSRDRLARRLSFGANPRPDLLVDALATRTHRPAADLSALLYGSTPVDDRALIALSQALSVLEQEVSRT
jgi:hypothetical protein